MVREWIDKLLRGGIKAVMLTSVAFTMAACYAPAPMPDDWLEPDRQPGDTTIVPDTTTIPNDSIPDISDYTHTRAYLQGEF